MKKSAKLTLLLLLAAGGGILAFAGAQPDALQSVSSVVESSDDLVGTHVELKATVKRGTFNNTGTPVTFELTDDVHDLPVIWTTTMPMDVNPEGRTVVLKGTLVRGADGRLVLMGEEVVMGCPSKYEEKGQPDENTTAAA